MGEERKGKAACALSRFLPDRHSRNQWCVHRSWPGPPHPSRHPLAVEVIAEQSPASRCHCRAARAKGNSVSSHAGHAAFLAEQEDIDELEEHPLNASGVPGELLVFVQARVTTSVAPRSIPLFAPGPARWVRSPLPKGNRAPPRCRPRHQAHRRSR